jgi:hypothetical protein
MQPIISNSVQIGRNFDGQLDIPFILSSNYHRMFEALSMNNEFD